MARKFTGEKQHEAHNGVNNSLIITDWEAGSRYDVGFSIRIDTLKKTSKEIEQWYEKLYSDGVR